MKRIAACIILIIITIANTHCWSQITTSGYIYTDKTKYSSEPQDDYYCFNGSTSVTLQASHSQGNGVSYEWRKFNETTKEWDIAAGTSNILPVTEQAGYQATITHSSLNTETYQCWIFFPTITGAGVVTSQEITCLPVNASISGFTITELDYYDLRAKGNPKEILPYKYHWASPENFITDTTTTVPFATLEIYKNTNLNGWVDGYGLTKVDAAPLAIIAKAVKAKFDTLDTKYKIKNEMDPDDANPNQSKRSAPLDVNFNATPEKNLRSMGENLICWWSAGADYGFRHDDEDQFKYHFNFTEAGDYIAKMALRNTVSNCTDTAEIAISITDTYMMIPNVFTPNGDGANDEFRVSYRSVQTFEMIIKNRWGRVVYKTDELDRGWDGRIAGKEAAPGVYFYNVSWTGYDGTNGDEQGFLHLLTGRR